MFSKAKKNNNAQNTSELVEISDVAERTPVRGGQNKAQAAKTSSRMSGNSKRPALRATGVPSLISGDVIIKGMIESEGEVQFDGLLEGDIRAKGLVIGEGASVKGEVVADKVKVSGKVEGCIRAGHVELASSAYVKGDILHSALSIENGARFDGNCRHSDDPVKDTMPKVAPAQPKPAPRPPASADAEKPTAEMAAKRPQLEEVISDQPEQEADETVAKRPVVK